MATLEECEQALAALVIRLAEVDPELRRKYAVERTVTCRVTDLDVVFVARFDADGTMQKLEPIDDGSAQVKLAASSDTVIALIEGRLPIGTAWATGKLKIDASMFDLLKLRTFL
jgi:putative sterol carrier protein